jgi:putative salt-induced outer membrane protein
MKRILFIYFLLTANNVFADRNIINFSGLADKLDFEGNEELSMIGEFGFLLADGNTNTSTITAKMNTSQELTSWSYQFIGDVLYIQSPQEVDGEKNNGASAQKLFLSGQFDHKFTDPNERMFIYGEYENNRFNGFRYQATISAGWSSRLWRDKHSELKYSFGPGYSISEIKQGNKGKDNKGIIVRAAMEYKRKFSEHAMFLQLVSIEIDQEFNKTESETSLTTKLTGSSALKLSFSVNLDTSVGPDIEELDTETVITLVYQFF